MDGSGPKRSAKAVVGGPQILPDAAGHYPAVALIPVFSAFLGPSDVLAAWLPSTPREISFSLRTRVWQFRRDQRFLEFKSSVDATAGPRVL